MRRSAWSSGIALRAHNMGYTYGDGTQALRGVTFELPVGARCALLGANGAGKSTLLLCLAGLLQATEGSLRVGDVILPTGKQPARLPTLLGRVGLVFQDPDDQLFGITVADDVAVGPRALRLPEHEVESRVQTALQDMGVDHLRDNPPHLLSLGEKRRVAIAGVLATGPQIVILDEPTAFLDPPGVRSLEEALARVASRGASLLVATHDVDFAAQWADQVVILHQGRVLHTGDRRILGCAQVMTEAQLRLPLVAQLFVDLGLSDDLLPLTVDEGRACLRQAGRTPVEN